MDREATLLRLDELVRPGGAVALVNTELHPLGRHTWHAAFEELRKSHGRFDDFYRWRKSDGVGGALERAPAQRLLRR